MGTIYRNGTPFIGSGGAGGVELTQAEYDALPTSEKMNGSIYFISDGEASYPSASTMRYDNSSSGLTATSVQAAVDEVNEKVNDNAGDIAALTNATAPLFLRKTYRATISVAASSYTLVSSTDLGMETPNGYSVLGVRSFFTGSENAIIYAVDPGSSASVLRVRNLTSSAVSNFVVSVALLYVKTGFIAAID